MPNMNPAPQAEYGHRTRHPLVASRDPVKRFPGLAALRDAQRHPELYRKLVVRIWGWSGCFCELGEACQNRIIGRHIYGA